VQVETPDPALDVLVNGWLIYQTLACRCGRAAATTSPAAPSAFATSCRTRWPWCTPNRQLVREHLLLSAGRQFVEGDVQHWWHPPAGRGVRTRCSDDYLWLPLAVCRYVQVTGDSGVLDEAVVPRRPRREPGEESYYDLPGRPARPATSTSTACAPSATACASARTACR
jgi:cyclic beta-1,2-glucan synthetase